MSQLNRRQFISQAGALSTGVAAGMAISGTTLSSQVGRAASATSGDKLRLAVLGYGGRGNQLAQGFASRSDCEIVYLCDANQSRLDDRIKKIAEAQSKTPKTITDFRRALDDKSVDAIVVATPDHWHALMAIMGCQAGKDVYIEKPVSQSPWEGRMVVEAARKYDRVVQVGTQNRSAPYILAAKEYLESGKLGTIHMAKVFNQKYQGNFAPKPGVSVPEGLDWNLWTGPAALGPYNQNHHKHWHHFWNFSGGDISNDGVHQLDLARWLCGKEYPKTVYSTGGRYSEEGELETPDSQIAVYQFDDLVMTFELTLFTPYMLKSDPVLRNSDMHPYWPQNSTRIEIYGTKGVMFLGRMGGGWQVFHRTSNRKPVVAKQMFGRFPDPDHKQNFFDCVRSRKRPNADILEGHRSALLCHYANISYRLGGRSLTVDAEQEQFVNDAEANAMLRREYREPWVVPEVKAT